MANVGTVPQPSGAPGKVFIALGFALSAIFTTGVTTYAGLLLAEHQVTRTEQLQRIEAFTKSSEAFPGLVREYSTAFVDHDDPSKAADKLKHNIVDQDSLLGDAENGLTQKQIGDAETYRSTLSTILHLLDTVHTADKLGPILQPLENSIGQRETVIADLRSSGGLTTKPVSESPR